MSCFKCSFWASRAWFLLKGGEIPRVYLKNDRPTWRETFRWLFADEELTFEEAACFYPNARIGDGDAERRKRAGRVIEKMNNERYWSNNLDQYGLK